ncbi:MAG: hypothetical protein CALGDGBN_03205 [Pseudomonadales bacterium]|nr:hypothetical protein [Pseudomonadales bacterium]
MILAIVVARAPDLPVGPLERDRTVIERAHQRVTPALQRREVDRRLHQRTDRTLRVQRAVEAGDARIATAHHRQHLAAVDAGHDHRALERFLRLAARAEIALDARQRLLQRLLGGALHRGVQAGEHAQPLGREHLLGVITAQLAAHQIEVRGVETRTRTVAIAHAHRLRADAPGSGLVDHALLDHQPEHGVTARAAALGVAPRVVVRGAAHQSDQQRDLCRVEFRDRAIEVIVAGEPEAVDRAMPVLPEVDLVQVGLEDLLLFVADLEHDRHRELEQLARDRALAGEEEVLHQLLGQRAAALLECPAAHVHPQRTRDALQRNTVVIEEVLVLDRHQRGDQQRRHLIRPYQDAVFVVRRVDAADVHRFEPRQRDLGAADVAHRADRVTGETHAQTPRRFLAVPEAEAARGQRDRRTAHREGSRNGARPRAIAERLELIEQRTLAERGTRVQLERARVDHGRHRPLLAGELALDACIEVHEAERRDHRQRDRGTREQPRPAPAARRCGRARGLPA